MSKIWLCAVVILTAACGAAYAQSSYPPNFSGVVTPGRQDTPPEPAKVSEATKEANVKLVFSYYRRHGDWADSTMLKLMSPDFIQHDVCEPSTEHAYAQIFRDQLAKKGTITQPSTAARPQPQGVHDSAGQGVIRSIVADGDIVVVLRDLYRPWPGGPVPYMKTSFADIWRVRGGKITEQWATVSPGDGFSSPTQGDCKYYHEDPPSNPPLNAP